MAIEANDNFYDGVELIQNYSDIINLFPNAWVVIGDHNPIYRHIWKGGYSLKLTDDPRLDYLTVDFSSEGFEACVSVNRKNGIYLGGTVSPVEFRRLLAWAQFLPLLEIDVRNG